MNLRVDDTGEMPFTVWGKVKSTLMGWNVAARVSADSTNINKLGLDVQASGGPVGTGIQVTGSADADALTAKIASVKLSQSVQALGGSLTVEPGYNLNAEKANVKVVYGIDGTAVVVNADATTQMVTVLQQLGDNNRIAPSITSDGDVTLEYRRAIQTGSLTATLKPKDSVNLRWADGKWMVNVNAPIEGVGINAEGIKFSASCTGL